MTLDATPGGVDANTYLTMAEANEYFKNRLHSSLWDSLEDKDPGLQTATRLLDRWVYYPGEKASESQALDWPRDGVVDEDGYYVSDDIIPKQIKEATCELLYFMIEDDPTAPNDMDGIKSLKVGSLQIVAEDHFNSDSSVIPEAVWKALGDMGGKSPSGFFSGEAKLIRV